MQISRELRDRAVKAIDQLEHYPMDRCMSCDAILLHDATWDAHIKHKKECEIGELEAVQEALEQLQ